MSRYVRNQIIRSEFDGDVVVATVSPMTLEELLLIEDSIPFKDASAEEKKAGHAKVYDLSVEGLKKHCQKIEGLTDAAGAAVGSEEVFRDAYFKDLVTDIFKQWYAGRKPVNPKEPGSSSTSDSGESTSEPKTPTSATEG